MSSTPASVGFPDSWPSCSLSLWSQAPEIQTQTLYNRISSWNDIWLIISAQYKGLLSVLWLLLCYFVSLCCCLIAKSCPALSNPLEYKSPVSSDHGISKQEYWSGLPFPSPGDLPIRTSNPHLPHERADSLPLSRKGSPCSTQWAPSSAVHQRGALHGVEGGGQGPMKARALSAITEFRKAGHLIYLQVRTLWSETVWAPVPLTSWTTLGQLLNSSALSFLTHKMGVIVTVIGYSFARACVTACHKREWLRQHAFTV